MDYLRYYQNVNLMVFMRCKLLPRLFYALQIGLKFLSEAVTLAFLIMMLISVNPILTLVLFFTLLVVTVLYAYLQKTS